MNKMKFPPPLGLHALLICVLLSFLMTMMMVGKFPHPGIQNVPRKVFPVSFELGKNNKQVLFDRLVACTPSLFNEKHFSQVPKTMASTNTENAQSSNAAMQENI